MVEEALQAPLKDKRDIFPVYEAFLDRFGDFGLCFPGLLVFPFRLIRLLLFHIECSRFFIQEMKR